MGPTVVIESYNFYLEYFRYIFYCNSRPPRSLDGGLLINWPVLERLGPHTQGPPNRWTNNGSGGITPKSIYFLIFKDMAIERQHNGTTARSLLRNSRGPDEMRAASTAKRGNNANKIIISWFKDDQEHFIFHYHSHHYYQNYYYFLSLYYLLLYYLFFWT